MLPGWSELIAGPASAAPGTAGEKYSMRNPVRVAAILAAAVLLLAAGEAPNGDLEFLNDIGTAPAEALSAPVVDMSEPDYAEPDLSGSELGLIVPEAGSLAQLVRDVRDAGAVPLDDNMRCLAIAIYFESKGEPLDGQLAVAQVILNRVEDGRFGRDICDVVKAPKQFSFVSAGRLPSVGSTAQWATAQAVAVIAKAGAWREVVPNATHFHATRVSPGWRLTRVATVGRHVFYR